MPSSRHPEHQIHIPVCRFTIARAALLAERREIGVGDGLLHGRGVCQIELAHVVARGECFGLLEIVLQHTGANRAAAIAVVKKFQNALLLRKIDQRRCLICQKPGQALGPLQVTGAVISPLLPLPFSTLNARIRCRWVWPAIQAMKFG